MRADLYAVLAAVAREERPPEAALARVMDAYAKAAATARLPRDDGPGAAPGLASRLARPRPAPRPLRRRDRCGRTARRPAPPRRLRRCPGRDCGWLFLDTSGRRRWCSMGACGSREKMRRMYARRRSGTSQGP
jgi:hypothetical protein